MGVDGQDGGEKDWMAVGPVQSMEQLNAERLVHIP